MPDKKSANKVKISLFNKPILKYTIYLLIGITIAFGLFILSVYVGVWGTIPSKQALKNITNSESSVVYDSENRIVGKFYLFDRTSIEFDDLPEHLVQALVATEDFRFYGHNGIDKLSLLRVLVKTLIMGKRSAGGGSTITQQLAKNLFPRENNTKLGLAIAKVKESIIAKRLEKIYSKDEILMLYLNTVSFSDNAFGIESASRKFFNKPVSLLTLPEAAVLIGSLKATYTYNPRLNPENSKRRRNTVLKQMVKYGYITDTTYEDFKDISVKVNQTNNSASKKTAPYFLEQVRRKLRNIVKGEKKSDGTEYNIYTDGLKVYTTLDLKMQQYAESAVRSHMRKLQVAFERNWGNAAPWKQKAFIDEVIKESRAFEKLIDSGLGREEALNKMREKRDMDLFYWNSSTTKSTSSVDSLLHYVKLLNTGFSVMNANTGGIKVWIGGIDHNNFKYDHVNQSKRQVGSTFKPFVYAAALENGKAPCEYIHGSALTYSNYEDWTPTNGNDDYDDQYLSMQGALSKSVNTVAVKLLEHSGIDKVIKLGQQAGIESDLPEVPSLALGTASLKMIELLKAYSIFTNNTSPVDPYFIEKVEDENGNVLYQAEGQNNPSVISRYTQSVMIEMLKSVTKTGGTGSRLRWKYGLQNDIAGKTGTTQSNKDGWFVGVTPNLIAVSWVGADNPQIHFKETSIGQGANSALPIFGLFYKKLSSDASYRTITRSKFEMPSDEVLEDLDCLAIKEETFLQSILDKDARVTEREYEAKDTTATEEVVKQKKLKDKLKGLFKRKK